jgi:hypothetical protein
LLVLNRIGVKLEANTGERQSIIWETLTQCVGFFC